MWYFENETHVNENRKTDRVAGLSLAIDQKLQKSDEKYSGRFKKFGDKDFQKCLFFQVPNS